jgi:dephospho-CoA kinase
VSKRTGKTIIGLTGNIATGKSVVRRMMEHLGAYTIDADSLAHRVLSKGAPGYQPTLDRFGKWVLDKDGNIDRAKLGKLVFSDADALAQLEEIVHPYVLQAVDLLIRRANQRVIVVEAIKLIESGMREQCDSIWVTDAPQEVQIERLMRKRNLTREESIQRIRAQAPQSDKLAAAAVIIRNTGSYDELWNQVSTEWKRFAPKPETGPLPASNTQPGTYLLLRGRPRDAQRIAEFISRQSKGRRALQANDVMEAFGEKAFLMLFSGSELVGVAGWQVENLVARTDDLFIDPKVSAEKSLPLLLNEVEEASNALQCEASLVFPPMDLVGFDTVWKRLGYSRRAAETLGSQAWMEAANESMPRGAALFFKQLRADRVLRPI